VTRNNEIKNGGGKNIYGRFLQQTDLAPKGSQSQSGNLQRSVVENPPKINNEITLKDQTEIVRPHT
jgi:hypothetical protein